ncbi:MAG: methylmalonyl Co-A mutase-associated GTPase MeaB [Acidobacteriia bacterium]|nr:methylmalonyl Co-A mutase-associated GTPase MeaB [Terriglobia bacterium]
MPVDVAAWAEQIRSGDIRAVSRAITAVEAHDPHSEELLRTLFPDTGRAFVLGITGAPGTGKSTLVDRLAANYRKAGHQVGIIAVDPTSPYTGGAILGDRIRMQGHAGDAGIFIRSMATRGFLGGLARATGEVALVLDAAGKEFILVETVGVGQDEVDIVRLADCTLVLLVPGLGDDVQNMKAGLMEIADIFVLNKSEREGADRMEAELEAMLHLAPERAGWKPRIIRTVATENKGIGELAAAVEQYREQSRNDAAQRAKRLEHWKRRLLALAEEQFLRRIISGETGESLLDALAGEVAARKKDPYAAARELLTHAEKSWERK